MYTVVEGDSLNGIAAHFGLSLEDLQKANPGIQASTLQPGATLVIPGSEGMPVEPTPTPASLQVEGSQCWREASGGAWCFARISNPYPETLENISALFTLLDNNGAVYANQVGFAMLNTLPPGSTLPLAVHFPPPLPGKVSLRIQVLTATRLLPGDARYLPVVLDGTLVEISSSGLTAHLTGRVVLTGEVPASTTWILAVAYDADGNVVGVRRWESASTLTAAESIHFDFLLSSLGPAIARVEFLVEARP